jgi:hypothetical protein
MGQPSPGRTAARPRRQQAALRATAVDGSSSRGRPPRTRQ